MDSRHHLLAVMVEVITFRLNLWRAQMVPVFGSGFDSDGKIIGGASRSAPLAGKYE